MGQAMRRAISRGGSKPSETSSARVKTMEQRPRVFPSETEAPNPSVDVASEVNPEITPRSANEGAVLEERDPGYDAMLSQMVGRIITKPGGKLEMGEAFVVEKYKRPLPKLRDTKADAGRDEKSVVAPGTLNVSQLRQVFLLHQGKDGGSMDVQQIAEKLRVDAAHVENILRHLSLPPESNKETEK